MSGYLTEKQAEKIFEICVAKVEQSQISANEACEILSQVAKAINERVISRKLYECPYGSLDRLTQKLPNDVVSEKAL